MTGSPVSSCAHSGPPVTVLSDPLTRRTPPSCPGLRASLAHYCSLQAPRPASRTSVRPHGTSLAPATEGAPLAAVHKMQPSAGPQVHPGPPGALNLSGEGESFCPSALGGIAATAQGQTPRASPSLCCQPVRLSPVLLHLSGAPRGTGAASQSLAVFLLPLRTRLLAAPAKTGHPAPSKVSVVLQQGQQMGAPRGKVLSSPLGEARQLKPLLKTTAPVGVSSPLLRVPGPLPSLDSWSCPLLSARHPCCPLLPSHWPISMPRVAPKSPLNEPHVSSRNHNSQSSSTF